VIFDPNRVERTIIIKWVGEIASQASIASPASRPWDDKGAVSWTTRHGNGRQDSDLGHRVARDIEEIMNRDEWGSEGGDERDD